MQLPLRPNLAEVRHRQRCWANLWSTPEPGQPPDGRRPNLPKQPSDSGSTASLHILSHSSETNRATASICRSPRPTSNFDRRGSWILHTDNLLAGKRSSLSWGCCRGLCCPAPLACELFRTQTERYSEIGLRLFGFITSGVGLHSGILFGFTQEHRSESSRNRVHLRPDSPGPSQFCNFLATGIPAASRCPRSDQICFVNACARGNRAGFGHDISFPYRRQPPH
jgi:hypothetical protein